MPLAPWAEWADLPHSTSFIERHTHSELQGGQKAATGFCGITARVSRGTPILRCDQLRTLFEWSRHTDLRLYQRRGA